MSVLEFLSGCQNHHCALCGVEFDLQIPNSVPILWNINYFESPKLDPDNTVVVCQLCRSIIKRLPLEFITLLVNNKRWPKQIKFRQAHKLILQALAELDSRTINGYFNTYQNRYIFPRISSPFDEAYPDARRDLKNMLAERQNHRCCYCGTYFDDSDPHKMATFEHVLPQDHGGNSQIGNLVIACRWCNNVRGNIPLSVLVTILRNGDWPVWMHGNDEKDARNYLNQRYMIYELAKLSFNFSNVPRWEYFSQSGL